MAQSRFILDQTEVFVEGDGPQTIVMIHGWPDTYRLWDRTVQALKGQHRCVRFTMPGFEGKHKGPVRSLAQMTALLRAIVDKVSPDKPVTLLLHDWGCLFGYELAGRHPDRVSRIIGVDVGDAGSLHFFKSLSALQKSMMLSYQLALSNAWLLGRYVNGKVGTVLTRGMSFLLKSGAKPEHIRWDMNFPYAMNWLGLGGGLRVALPVKPHCPTLYIYGQKKPFMFHTSRWIHKVMEIPGSRVVGLPGGHWVMLDQPEAFEETLLEWLKPAVVHKKRRALELVAA